jgi:cytochrome c biogenesis protein CcdA
MFDPDTDNLERGGASQTHTSQSAKAFFAAILLIFVLCGLAIHLLAPHIGMAPELAHRVAGIMLVVCGVYALMLFFWDRVFGR